MVATLLTVVIVLVILGLAVYMIETYLPQIPGPFRIAIRGVVVIGFLLWLLYLVRGGDLGLRI